MTARRLIGQGLKDLGVTHEGAVQEALALQKEKGGRLGDLMIELGHVTRQDVTRRSRPRRASRS
jgi:type IV pilus assembly protein PilB